MTDELLSFLLPLLANHGMARTWSQSATPYSDLAGECRQVVGDETVCRELAVFVRRHPLIARTVGSFLTHYSTASHVRAEQIPFPARLLAQRGVYLGLWIPTFLVIDGPFARILRAPESPLRELLRTRYREFHTLCQARDLLQNDLFRRLRNGIAHWSFVFDIQSGRERLIAFDHRSGVETASLDVLEANALHGASLAIVDCIDNLIVRRVLESTE